MAPADDGCLYPVIDKFKCVECGACVRVCPVTKEHAPNFHPHCYAARTRSRELLRKSSSGGIFSELARPVLAQGGCVFGCAMQSLAARHIKVEDEAGLAELRGSKYVQSDMGDCYMVCRAELRKGRRVLFSGAPCQIAGLRAFLGKEYDNLLCVALICHGASVPLSLCQYIREEESRLGGKVTHVAFRDKTARPGEQSFSLTYIKDGQEQLFAENWSNVYMRAFLDSYTYRECCFACSFRSGRSGADIVLGDFWGIETVNNSYNTNEGASVVLVYTPKGKAAFAQLSVDSFPADYKVVLRRNANLEFNPVPPKARARFLKMIRQGGGYYAFFKRVDHVSLPRRVVRKLKNLARPLYRKIRYGK